MSLMSPTLENKLPSSVRVPACLARIFSTRSTLAKLLIETCVYRNMRIGLRRISSRTMQFECTLHITQRTRYHGFLLRHREILSWNCHFQQANFRMSPEFYRF